MATTSDQPGASPAQSEQYWFVEIWREVRPFIIRLIADFAIFAVLWTLLVAAHALTAWLPLQTALSWLVLIVHECGVVLTFLWLSGRAFCEIIYMRKGGVVDVLSRLTKRV